MPDQTEQDLFRVVYFSRNAIGDGAHTAEINNILETAQQNNASAAVSGVLVFNNGVFGQVLEGPAEAVEDIFDRIQADPRHYDVTILEAKPVEARQFARWSMGFIGADAAHQALFATIGTATEFDLERMNSDAIFGALVSLALKNEVALRAA